MLGVRQLVVVSWRVVRFLFAFTNGSGESYHVQPDDTITHWMMASQMHLNLLPPVLTPFSIGSSRLKYCYEGIDPEYGIVSRLCRINFDLNRLILGFPWNPLSAAPKNTPYSLPP